MEQLLQFHEVNNKILILSKLYLFNFGTDKQI